MVARDMPPTGVTAQLIAALRSVASALLAAWRRALGASALAGGRITTAARLGVRRWAAQWPAVTRYFRDPAVEWASAERAGVTSAAAFSARAFAFGLLAGIALDIARGGTARIAVAAALVEVLWAGGRFAILLALVPGDRLRGADVAAAYLTGLAPYALAWTGGLRVVALVVSAVLVARALRAAGLARPEARLAVGWAFGGQLAVVAVGIALRATLAAVMGV